MKKIMICENCGREFFSDSQESFCDADCEAKKPEAADHEAALAEEFSRNNK